MRKCVPSSTTCCFTPERRSNMTARVPPRTSYIDLCPLGSANHEHGEGGKGGRIGIEGRIGRGTLGCLQGLLRRGWRGASPGLGFSPSEGKFSRLTWAVKIHWIVVQLAIFSYYCPSQYYWPVGFSTHWKHKQQPNQINCLWIKRQAFSINVKQW